MHRFNAMRQQAMMKIHFESGPSNLKNCADKSKVLIMIIETDSRPRLTLPLVLQKVASELHPKVRNHGEGPY